MHSNAANKQRFSYAARFGRGGSLARHMVKLLMATLMIFGMAAQVQAEGSVNPTTEKTGYWALYGTAGANSTSTATEVCLAWGRHLLGSTLVFYEFLSTEQNADYYASLGMLNCIFRVTTTNVIASNGSIIPVTRRFCPANSTEVIRGSCTCNTNFKPDPTVTSCIPVVQYTIALHDLNVGGELATLASRAAYAQVMEGAAAKSGIAVTLTTSAPPEAGTLTFSPPSGVTGGPNNRFDFLVTAPSVGGTHTVTATCDGGKCSNQATGTVVVTACPVPALTAPPFTEVCAQVLESINSTQAQKDAACGALTPALKTGMSCLRDKLTAMTPAIPMRVTSDIRSIAYQAHLRQVWDRMEDVVDWMVKNPTIQTACAARRAEIAAEKGCDNAGGCTSCYAESAAQRSHCLVVRPANPSPNDALHTQGNAFDVSQGGTINPLLAALAARDPPQNIQQFLNAPTNCNLNWGGSFDDPDPVHFHVPVP